MHPTRIVSCTSLNFLLRGFRRKVVGILLKRSSWVHLKIKSTQEEQETKIRWQGDEIDEIRQRGFKGNVIVFAYQIKIKEKSP